MRPAQLLRELGALAFPSRCQLCDRLGPSPICEECAAAFEAIQPPLCLSCGRPFDPRSHARPTCGDCADGRRAFASGRSFGLHVGGLRDAVNGLKFGGRTRLAAPLGRLLIGLVDGEAPVALGLEERPNAIVPVPLHPTRRDERSFDQAELIATSLSKAIGVPLRNRLLMRTRHTAPQIGLTPRQRKDNVKGAFSLRHPLPGPGARVLLVDDVYTTGATLEECARTLRRAGAEAVYAVTVTRAAPEWHPLADLGDGV